MLQAVVAKAHQTGLALLLGAVFALAAPVAQARGEGASDVSQVANPATMTLAELPREGRSVYQLILQGGPFAHDKDGVVFGNRERLLPRSKRGYYREYTVRTPGARDRGARRIVCGGAQPQRPDACYYTSDHYNSFRQITE